MKKSIVTLLFYSLLTWGRLSADYTYQLAAVLMFQDEAQFLQEWIEYHKLIGIEHFYLYNNLSTDNYMEILKPYIDNGEIELFHYPSISNNQLEYVIIQQSIYNHAISLARNQVKWLAIIDADEFICPLEKADLRKFLKKYEKYGGVYLNWLNFGTSGIAKIPEGHLMIETLLKCAKDPVWQGKSIVRPERVRECSHPHFMIYKPPYFDVTVKCERFPYATPPVTASKALIFHYYTRDLDHLVNVKYPRRKKWTPNIPDLDTYICSMDVYNAVYNPSMLRFVKKLRYRLNQSAAK